MLTANSNTHSQSDVPVVVVTGGTQGLGLALAQVLLDSGFAVSLCARTEADVNAARVLLTGGNTACRHKSPQAHQDRLLALTGDVSNPDFQRTFIAKTVASFGRIDALVNNASTLGTLPMPNVLDSTPEHETYVFDVNVFAALQLVRHAMPHLVKQPRSLVLGISSDAAVGGYPGWGIYGASKAALDLFHKTLAAELADPSVQVHSVDPGDMDTAMHHAADPDAQGLVNPAVVANALLPLFQQLNASSGFPFPSGARLQVTSHGLIETEVTAQ